MNYCLEATTYHHYQIRMLSETLHKLQSGINHHDMAKTASRLHHQLSWRPYFTAAETKKMLQTTPIITWGYSLKEYRCSGP